MSDGERLLPRLHLLLLRVAGWAPDEVVCLLRARLAEGRLSEVARSLLSVVVAGRIPIRPDDAGLLARMLPDVPEIALLAGAVPADGTQRPAYAFAPVLAPAHTPPPVLDLSATVAVSPADHAARQALGQVAHPLGLWRSWRSTAGGRHVPVYLVHSGADAADLPGAADWIQGELARAGVGDPQVEVWGPGVGLPPYQRLALGRSALLWAAEPARPVTVARVFDSWDPVGGGRFETDHPLLDAGDERARVLDYLRRGRVLTATTVTEPDVFDPGAGGVIPMSFRTDGTWIWTDAVIHYLNAYALSPDAELLAHIRERDHVFTEPSPVAEHRAMVALTAPAPSPSP
ncbi:hypothetical protein Aph02nite_77650 [Actinoplanes philippinensis]|uniref:Uncharacterized protein n=1 Tax=Actinoplanes philippinensis TaxID=35752 RepID=A0A1I2HJZ8_9ACTN|nr:hypothetical protein [Actinoplanes philippinensis]GIE81815.1 hypothetical protein Aph02nite_77650 [Actinoplanes philippinensis]SFF29066.1 hypothetical protein SAMN05421541_108196 [Actinoplanes philippinensis]